MKSVWNGSNWSRFHGLILPLILLAIATVAAYANAWPNVLVHDDMFFAGSARFSGITDFSRFFTEDLWAASGVHSGLYRPMLLISLFVESRLWGDWMAGYHLSNVFLHMLVTFAVFGFIRQVLRMSDTQSSSADLYALLAALVFCVHPAHTEVVNSIFNRSEILVALSGTAGLWWFLRYLDTRTFSAWGGLSVAYLFAIFSKESAIVLPGLAVSLVLIFTPGDWRNRLQKCLPVLWLLIPLALYFALRDQALATPASMATTNVTGHTEIETPVNFSSFPDWRMILKTAGVWSQSFKVLVWPWPLKLYYEDVSIMVRWAALLLHLALIAAALFGYKKKSFGLIAGLVFFYIAMLPASRFIGLLGEGPHMAERYLYFPSVGLVISLAFGLHFLGHRFGTRLALAPVMIALIVFTPICLARNAEWASEIILFESEFRKGSRDVNALRLLTGARLRQGNISRVVEICDSHVKEQKKSGRYSSHCAMAYSQLGRDEEAERAFLFATTKNPANSHTRANLAVFYLRLGRVDEGRKHYELALEAEVDPAMRAYRKGELLVIFHRNDREKLIEARAHFEEALRLQPHLALARGRLERLNQALGLP